MLGLVRSTVSSRIIRVFVYIFERFRDVIPDITLLVVKQTPLLVTSQINQLSDAGLRSSYTTAREMSHDTQRTRGCYRQTDRHSLGTLSARPRAMKGYVSFQSRHQARRCCQRCQRSRVTATAIYPRPLKDGPVTTPLWFRGGEFRRRFSPSAVVSWR